MERNQVLYTKIDIHTPTIAHVEDYINFVPEIKFTKTLYVTLGD